VPSPRALSTDPYIQTASEGDVPEDIAEMNETAAELFEERFGQSLEDALGHSH